MGVQRHSLERILKRAVDAHQVPGAALAVRSGSEVIEVADGVVSNTSHAPVTTETLFPIGSITKLLTTTLTLSLVDEGRLALDAPIHDYAPEIRLAEEEGGQEVTLRHLLTHTSGIDGDPLEPARASASPGQFVAECAPLPMVSRPGVIHSYCNVGFALAAYLAEKALGGPYSTILQERVLGPLGIDVVVDPDAVGDRLLVDGHLRKRPDTDPLVAPHLPNGRAMIPVGSWPCAPAGGLLRISSLVLGPPSVLRAALMAEALTPKVAPPDGFFESVLGWGLGWVIYDWGGERVVGHDGMTGGCQAWLRVFPDRDAAVSLQANLTPTHDFSIDVLGLVCGDLLGVTPPPAPHPLASPPTLEVNRFAGLYERADTRIEVKASNGGLAITTERRGSMSFMQPDPVTSPLEAVTDTTFLSPEPIIGAPGPIAFSLPDAKGRFQYVTEIGRAARRLL